MSDRATHGVQPAGKGAANGEQAHGGETKAPGAEPAEPDHHGRTGFCTKVWVHEFGPDGEPDAGMTAESMDISPSGMGLRSRRMMYVARSVLIVLDLPGMPPRVMCAVVQSSTYSAAGMYEINVEFCDMPTMARLKAWLQRRTAAA